MVKAIRRSNFTALGFFLMLLPLGNAAHAREKPEIIRLDAEYLEMVVKINVHWQSPNPVTVIRAIVGREQKELKVDEYDNRRNPDGYSGEAVIIVNAVPTAGRDGIPYVVQIEDDLRQKSEQVTGSVKAGPEFAGGGAASYPGTPGAGAGAWTASGAWSASGTGVPPGSGGWPPGGTSQGGGGWPPGGSGQGSGGWSAGGSGPGGGSWPAGGSGQGGSSWPAGGSGQGGGAWSTGVGGSVGSVPPGGDPWSKAKQGRPGELIDKSIGMFDPKGKGGRGTATTAGTAPPAGIPPPAGSGSTTGSSGLPRNLQNENFAPGGKVAFIDGLRTGDEVAVVLGPVDQQFRLIKIFFLFGGSTGKGIVTLKISQEAGVASSGAAPLFSESFEVQGTDTALQEVDLAQLGGAVSLPGGSIRVSFQVQHSGLPGIGYDPGAPAAPGKNWISRSGSWVEFGAAGFQGNGIVRATIAQ